MESARFLVVLTVFKTVVAPRKRGEVGSIPTLSDVEITMDRRSFISIAAIVLLGKLGVGVSAHAEATDLKSRAFLFTYAASVRGLNPSQVARIWLPVPPSNQDQEVTRDRVNLPNTFVTGSTSAAENQVIYFESQPRDGGVVSFGITYCVLRHEVLESGLTALDVADGVYLKPDALVPLGGKPMTLLQHRALPPDQFSQAHLLYDIVDDHMQYRKDRPGWGRGDAVWACDSGFGNCTDFHSLFISLARSQGIPAIFEIGFSIPARRTGVPLGDGDVAGYHCWAKFKARGHGWTPVDISEANKDPAKRAYYFGRLDENRVLFTAGRDLVLSPRQAGPPLNFFIYPYVEVDGKPWPTDRVKCAFHYHDLDGSAAAPSR